MAFPRSTKITAGLQLNALKGLSTVISGTNKRFHKKPTIPTVKYVGGSVMVWSCFAALDPGRLAVVDGIMISAAYQKTLKENVGYELKIIKKPFSYSYFFHTGPGRMR